jgi:hypothetical protein
VHGEGSLIDVGVGVCGVCGGVCVCGVVWCGVCGVCGGVCVCVCGVVVWWCGGVVVVVWRCGGVVVWWWYSSVVV